MRWLVGIALSMCAQIVSAQPATVEDYMSQPRAEPEQGGRGTHRVN